MKPTVFLDPRRIRDFRHKLGLSQGRLAECLQPMRNSSQKTSLTRTIQEWEKYGHVSEKWAIHLARALKVELVDLIKSAVNTNDPTRVKEEPFIDGIAGKEMQNLLTDTTAIQTSNGKMYFCFVFDPQQNAVVGFSLHHSPLYELIVPAVSMATGYVKSKLPAMQLLDRGVRAK